jgi:hypothetical protein
MKADSDCIYVNQDGTARELSAEERSLLSQEFTPGDGTMPYMKLRYTSRDGWGSFSGFLPRRDLPATIFVQPVNPDYSSPIVTAEQKVLEMAAQAKAAGYSVSQPSARSIRIEPGQGKARQESFEILRRLILEKQKQQEDLARHPDYK